MKRKDLYNAISEVDDDILERSEIAYRSKKKPVWLKWGAIAACLCLVMAVAIPTIFHQPAETPRIQLIREPIVPVLLVSL